MMDIHNLRIRTQLKLGFAILLMFVVVLGMVSYLQTEQIHQQTEIMYNHPLQVRRALGAIRGSIRSIQIEYRNMLLTDTEEKQAASLQMNETHEAEALLKFAVLRDKYLGPQTDVDNAWKAFVAWESLHKNGRDLIGTVNIKKSMARIANNGDIGIARNKLLDAIEKMDTFALEKGNDLYAASKALKDNLHRQLLLCIATIVFFSLAISYFLSQNIRRPLRELIRASQRFQEGEMDARSSYASPNEFGELSKAFNTLAENIQVNMVLNQQSAQLSGLMLREDDAKKFFCSTLANLAEHTGSHLAAVYLLSDDRNSYEHFESIGIDGAAKRSFDALRPEGEFGAALATREVQHIKDISTDTRFVFHTVTGKFIPREILTIPIHSNDAVVAIISLASVNSYPPLALQLIDTVHVTLSARIEGILGYKKIKEFSKKLEQQNIELQIQETEMAEQAAELRQQNSELEMQKQQLDEANRLKTVFLSNMSHELRTPLNSVIVLSGVLNRSLANKIPDEEYSYLEVIERNGKYLLALINDILDISRIESGREEFELTQFNANDLIAEEVSLIHPQALEKDIQLRHVNSNADIFIVGDRNKCRHILQNIIGNAVKFTENGSVEVTAQQNTSTLAITVTDTGIGMSADDLPHVFEEFRQVDGSTSRRYGGTGLGLAIAKKYATLLGGTISVNSTLGKGSEFTITLPLLYAVGNQYEAAEPTLAFQQTRKISSPTSVATLSTKTLLVVDDSEPVIIQLKDILEEKGYILQVARDGGEALASISRTIPDAMILDLMMPDTDGFEVLKKLREAELTSHIPILILTAKHITKEDLKVLKQNNVHQLIQKGDVNRNELLNAVATMIFPEPTTTIAPQRDLPVIQGKPVVLVVEDNPDNMLTTKALLIDKAIVIEAFDGKQGIEMAKEHRPHLILMDIGLPGMNGLDTLRAIRAEATLEHVPVIALTASALAYDRETILAEGFAAHILKPIDVRVFSQMIDEALYGR